jgi:hypothetical protein
LLFMLYIFIEFFFCRVDFVGFVRSRIHALLTIYLAYISP